MNAVHQPVMRREALEALSPRDGSLYVDGTFGGGGYTRAILEAADCSVLAIDRDPDAIRRGKSMQADFPGRLTLIEGRFGDMESLLHHQGVERIDGVALDVGVSAAQIDDPRRGFSFLHDGPLDMRMEQSGPSAADIVNTWPEKDLARAIAVYGEQTRAHAIARAVVRSRAERPLTRTSQLAELVARVLPSQPRARIHPATKTFQALRILVNDELTQLARVLAAAETLLVSGGRLVTVAFHSLEDRLIKKFLAVRSTRSAGVSRHQPEPDMPPPSFRLLFRGAKRPSDDECAKNPRAQSARMRAGERLDAPAHPAGPLHQAVAAAFPAPVVAPRIAPVMESRS